MIQVKVVWVRDGVARRGTVVGVNGENPVVKINGEEFEFEPGQGRYFYEINNSQEPVLFSYLSGLGY